MTRVMNRVKGKRKLLTAAVGVATISYVYGCGEILGGETSGNLVAPPPQPDAGHVDSGTEAPADAPDAATSDDAGAGDDAGILDGGGK